jgi:hypothetical protein
MADKQMDGWEICSSLAAAVKDKTSAVTTKYLN